MNISTFVSAVILFIASFHAVAQNVILKPVDQRLETRVCHIAATQGYAAAKQFIRLHGFSVSEFKASVSCNDDDLKTFAAKYKDNRITEDAKTIKLVAKDKGRESAACIDAITLGEAQARAKYQLEGEKIFCNYKEMSEFVRKYDKENLVITVITEEE